VYYVVYACDSTVWDKLVAKYLYDIVDNVPQQEAKQKIAEMFKELNEDTKNEKEKSEQVFREEVRAQLQVLQEPPMNASEQRAAYRSGDSAKIAAASVTKADTDYIAALAAIAGVE
jgi:beta-phosphoglucomutase-like phosphatase (HAD superfamily)